MPIRFDQPVYLLLLLLAVPIVLSGMRALRAFDTGRRRAAIGLRVAVLVVLTLMLAGFQSVRSHDGLAVVAVVDDSESVTRVARPPTTLPQKVLEAIGVPAFDPSMPDWIRGWLHAASRDREADDQLGLITFDGRPTVQMMPNVSASLDRPASNKPSEGTDAASALRLAMAMFGPDTGRRIVLVSDGNDTSLAAAPSSSRLIDVVGPTLGQAELGASELLAVAREAAAARIPIDVLPIEYQATDEVMVEGIYLPTEVRLGETVDVRVVVRSTQPVAGTMYMRRGGVLVNLSGSDGSPGQRIAKNLWRLDPATGEQVLVYRAQIPTSEAGVAEFEAFFEPDGETDRLASNNRAESFVKVHGRGSVLLVAADDDPGDGTLAQALRSQGVNVIEGKPRDIPSDFARMQPLDAIVFQSVPEAVVSDEQQEMIAEYVNELGGGFVMIGGPNSFGAGGWTHTVIDDLLPIECEVPDEVVLPAGALVLIIDRSGSMNATVSNTTHTKQAVANEAAAIAIQSLYDTDYVGVLAFDDRNRWVVPLGIHDLDEAAELARSIRSGGGTAIYPALAAGFHGIISKQVEDAAVKHVVLLTDGQGAGGDYNALLKRFKEEKVSLSTIGVGDQIDAPLLERLARQGGGKFYHVSDPSILPEIFMREALVVRRTLIREKPFRPVIRPSGSPVMTGINHTPRLEALVITGPKNRPTIYQPMVSEFGDPLFAHWQVGLGRSAAFTSDASTRWAPLWVDWTRYSDFWGRLIRRIARPPASREYELTSTIRGSSLHVRLDTGDPQAARTMTDVVGRVLMPSGEAKPVTLEQTAPGVFEATLPANDPGNYVVSVLAGNASGQRTYAFGGANRPEGAELRAFSSNTAVLEQIAEITGGRVLDPASPEANLLFQRDASFTPSRSVQPMWRPLLVLLFMLFLLDVAVRRLTWSMQSIRKALRGFITTHDAQTGETLSNLRQKSAAQTATAEPSEEIDTDPIGIELERERRRKRRREQFEAARAAADARTMQHPDAARKQQPASDSNKPAADAKPAAAASTEKPKDKPKPQPPATEPAKPDGVTSRLLAAKRRARQDMDDS